MPVTQFKHVMTPERREKPRYLFMAQLLSSLRHGTLILGVADFEELEELEEQPDDILADGKCA